MAKIKGVVMVVIGLFFSLGIPMNFIRLVTKDLEEPDLWATILAVIFAFCLSSYFIWNGIQWIKDKPTSEEE